MKNPKLNKFAKTIRLKQFVQQDSRERVFLQKKTARVTVRDCSSFRILCSFYFRCNRCTSSFPAARKIRDSLTIAKNIYSFSTIAGNIYRPCEEFS